MLTLNDGRNELWQWDTGRKLTVDADCSQVHFSNKIFGRSIDVDVVGGVAIIPDVILQTDKDLTAWAFVGTAEDGYTKISKVFKVNKRNKPADYVFTPPEQTSLEEILEKIDYLESIQDPDAIKNAVEDYLEQNPVEAPVQSVNGKTGEVDLTAEDVGAISQDKLQEATNEALAQAKASGEFDGDDGKDGYTPVKGIDYFTDEDKTEIAEMAAELVEVPESGGNADQSGLSTTAANLLIEILRNGLYSPDQSENITALATELGVTEEEEPDEPDTVTYTVTNNLTNVVNSSSVASVAEGESYTAMLTAAEGYELNTVNVTMGGVDVTSTVYLDGAISIATVSGDIVITATAKAEPVIVPMTARYDDRQNTIIYADDGTEKLEETTCTMVLSEDVFTEDTEVTVTIETNGAMYSKMYGACYLPGIDITTVATEKPFYHAELLFNAWNDVVKAGTYIKTYTVKAGYGLAIVNQAPSVAPVTAVTVTA